MSISCQVGEDVLGTSILQGDELMPAELVPFFNIAHRGLMEQGVLTDFMKVEGQSYGSGNKWMEIRSLSLRNYPSLKATSSRNKSYEHDEPPVSFDRALGSSSFGV